MTQPSAASFRHRPVTSDDSAALERFRCARADQPWSTPVERYLRFTLATELAGGHVQSAGLWNGNDLVAVIVWKVEQATPGVVRCHFLATALGFRGCGCAKTLKEKLLADAWVDDQCVIVSWVHEDNQAMLQLNRKLGAKIHPPGEGDDGYCLSVINVI